MIVGARAHLTQSEQTTHAYSIHSSKKDLSEYLYLFILFFAPHLKIYHQFFVPSACLLLSIFLPCITLSSLSSFIRPTGLLRPSWQGQSLYVFICITGVETDEYIGTDPLFSAMGSTDLDAMKGIPKQNSVCVCVKERESLKGIHYSISFLFCPDPLIGICMTQYARNVYCKDDYWCKQQYIYCCSPSLFCR